MDGDIAPLRELLALAERHGAWLVIDDAHGFGVLGEHGHGVLEHAGLRYPNSALIGKLGKDAGGAGDLVAGHATVNSRLATSARPYMFTPTPRPPYSHPPIAAVAPL